MAGRVLYTLNAKESSLFFPEQLASADYDLRDLADYDSLFEALRASEAEAVVTSWSTPQFQADWLEQLPNLRYIAHTTGSVRYMLPRRYLEQGLMVTNWGTLASTSVAEHALLLVLAGLRRLSLWPNVIAGESPWHPAPVPTQSLYGRRVGLHGFGNVARALVNLLRPFGVELSAFSPGVPRDEYTKLGVRPCEDLEELFASSEILVECEALSPRTAKSVTRQILERLPTGALFVNVGRGAITDEAALADLAQSGHLRLALDVYATDPISPQSPLHQVREAILSPHIAGPTVDQLPNCGALVKRNLRAFYAGAALEAQVTLEIYDRAT